MRPRRIAVDWDSTLAEEVWPGIGEWLPGAKAALRLLSAWFDEVVIFTLRVCPVDIDEETPRDPRDQFEAIESMLEAAGIPDNVYVWDRPYKPPAQFYVDDRAYHFGGSWVHALSDISMLMDTNHKEETVEENCMDGNCPCREPQPTTVVEPRFEHDSPRITQAYKAGNWYIADGVTFENTLSGQKQTHNVTLTPDTPDAPMRLFETGATRNVDTDSLDYEGFLSPFALRSFAEYMHSNRRQADGTIRASDNWQKGIPVDSYMKSMFRHFMSVWTAHRVGEWDDGAQADMVRDLCALLFNVQGYLHEITSR